ncbi:MAG: dihydropteridine reductase [Clostridia bacterium]|nr:dihydropteridine reductase [Clostridia bacterium]
MNRNDQEFIAQKIRTQYVEEEQNELSELRRLDKEVKRPAKLFAYIFGTAGALVLGTGMSLAMKIIGNAMIPGIVIGLLGIAMVSVNYKLYSVILAKRRAKYADRIIRLSDKIINN